MIDLSGIAEAGQDCLCHLTAAGAQHYGWGSIISYAVT